MDNESFWSSKSSQPPSSFSAAFPARTRGKGIVPPLPLETGLRLRDSDGPKFARNFDRRSKSTNFESSFARSFLAKHERGQQDRHACKALAALVARFRRNADDERSTSSAPEGFPILGSVRLPAARHPPRRAGSVRPRHRAAHYRRGPPNARVYVDWNELQCTSVSLGRLAQWLIPGVDCLLRVRAAFWRTRPDFRSTTSPAGIARFLLHWICDVWSVEGDRSHARRADFPGNRSGRNSHLVRNRKSLCRSSAPAQPSFAPLNATDANSSTDSRRYRTAR